MQHILYILHILFFHFAHLDACDSNNESFLLWTTSQPILDFATSRKRFQWLGLPQLETTLVNYLCPTTKR